MSTTKRYKQPSENNYRFQDIPPRFKRQKSLTSQKIQSTMDSSHINHPPQKNKKSWGDSVSSNGSGSTQKGSQFPREGRKIVKKLSTQRAQQNAEKTLLTAPTQPFVLSPMENKLFSLVRNDEHENPQFSCSHPQNCPPSSSSYFQPSVPLCDSFTNNSNIHHHTTVPSKPDPYGWIEKNQTSNQFNSPEQRVSPTPSGSSQRSMSNASPHTNYSDPDIRTIEMLRELERVADQTDVGNEESSNNKDLLVSHHLRMLMCAVDRYTQGVEDEEGNDSREDEVLPQETSRYIPSPPQIQIKNNSQNKEFSDTDSAFSDDYSSPCKPVNQFPTAQIANQPMFNAWNPWATPSFNALDVYAVTSPNANHNNIHSHPSMFMFDNNNMYYARDSF